MNNEGKPKFEIKIDDFDYENESVSSKENTEEKTEKEKFVIDKSFFDQYSYYDEAPETVAENVEKPKKKKSEWGFVIRMVVAVAVVFASIGMALICFSAADDILGIDKKSGTIVVEIPEGASVAEVGKILEDAGVIKFPSVFKFYVGKRYSSATFLSGPVAIDLSQANGYDNIVAEIRQAILAETVTLSFPEGYTIEQIADKLDENGVCSKTNFIAAIKSVDFSDYNFIKKLDYDNKYLALEGYIFPDTYDFYLNDSATNVVKKFLDNFEARFTDEMEARADELGLTVDEVIILASIVQKEAGDPKEMSRVSSVFHNRLNNTVVTQGRLESDVTIDYVEQYIFPNLDDTSKKDGYSAQYNTYKCIGIPVGAVCNPGTAAINAVLYPEETNYYFFVTDILGNYYYAQTLSEHNDNVIKAFAVGKED